MLLEISCMLHWTDLRNVDELIGEDYKEHDLRNVANLIRND